MSSSPLEIVNRYFSLVAQFSPAEEFDTVFHPEIEQTEYPNLLTRKPTVSDRQTLYTRMEAGKKVLVSQSYDIRNTIEAGETLIVETVWKGVIRETAGPFVQGQELTAYFCVIFEFRDGLIYRQRNYDCFETA